MLIRFPYGMDIDGHRRGADMSLPRMLRSPPCMMQLLAGQRERAREREMERERERGGEKDENNDIVGDKHCTMEQLLVESED